jgi:hypothetical protein
MVGGIAAESAIGWVRLVARESDDVDPLLVRYAPRFVAFPEQIQAANPPWPARTHDYHPRPVWTFIDYSRSWATASLAPYPPVGPRHSPLFIAGAVSYAYLSLLDLLRRSPAYLGRTVEVYHLVFLLALGQAAAILLFPEEAIPHLVACVVILGLGWIAWWDQRRHFSRPGRRPIRDRLEKAWPKTLPLENLSLSSRVDATAAWRAYARIIARRGDRYERTVYGRVVDAGRLVAVQYWLFFFYNHWRNVHEADWEVVTVFHNKASDTVRDVCLSSHEGGHRRFRDQVAFDGDHPIVYVAVGSHALYFEPRGDGYDPALSFGAPKGMVRVTGRVSVGRDRDWVPSVEADKVDTLPVLAYRLAEMVDPAGLNPRSADWAEWWWLAYGGKWGRITPIAGPPAQGIKWSDPAAWADTLHIEIASRERSSGAGI